MADLKPAAEKRFNELAKGSKIGIPSGKFRWNFRSATGKSDEEIKQVFTVLDVDNNGHVSIDEFLAWVENPSNEDMARLFLGLDCKSSGAAPVQGQSGGNKPAGTQPSAAVAQPSVSGRPPAVPGRRQSISGMQPKHSQEIFALLDDSGNRSLELVEWEVFNDLCRKVSPEMAAQVASPRNKLCMSPTGRTSFNVADADGSGSVDEKEFFSVHKRNCPNHW